MIPTTNRRGLAPGAALLAGLGLLLAACSASGGASPGVSAAPTTASSQAAAACPTSQPAPFSRGQTRVVPRTRIGVQEDGKKFAVVREGVSLQQLVDGLNALGIGPRDLIAILQAIKAAGAIQAEIEVM